MSESNPMRWVVLSVVAGLIFAVGLTTYIRHQVDSAKAEAAAASLAMEVRTTENDKRMTSRLDRAAAVAAPFIVDVGAGRFAQAYTLLAAPYQRAVSVEAFANSCRASPILASARGVTLRQLRQQSAGAATTLEARGVLDSPGGGVPIDFVFLDEAAGPRILVVSLAGVPVLQGVAPAR
jgi:phosphate/sulfate permease